MVFQQFARQLRCLWLTHSVCVTRFADVYHSLCQILSVAYSVYSISHSLSLSLTLFLTCCHSLSATDSRDNRVVGRHQGAGDAVMKLFMHISQKLKIPSQWIQFGCLSQVSDLPPFCLSPICPPFVSVCLISVSLSLTPFSFSLCSCSLAFFHSLCSCHWIKFGCVSSLRES